MKSMLDTFLDEITKGLYTDVPAGTYTPTLVVGLGGTGLKVLRHLKKALLRHQTQAIRLLGIDTDDSENRKFPVLPELSKDELVLLESDSAIRALARAEKGIPEAQFVKDYLPNESAGYSSLHQTVRGKIQMKKGAGQFRRAGKLLFCSNVGDGVNLDNIFRKLRVELMGLSTVLSKRNENIEIERGSRVYVVCSVAGGTGAGCLIDLLGLVRRHFDGPTDSVTSVCLLPGRALDCELTDPREEKRNTRGNAIGVLRELSGYMLGQLNRHPIIFDAHTKVELANKNLVNCVYLVGDTMWNGTHVERWFDLCQAVANFLYGVVGTGVGSSQQSGAVNHNIQDDARQKASPAIFNALGVGVVEYPVDEMTAVAFRSTVHDLLGGWLDEKFNRKDADSLFTQVVTELQLGSLGDVQSAYDSVTQDIPEARYLKSEGDSRKRALARDDDGFIGMAESKINEIDGQLAGYDEQLFQLTQTRIREIQDKLDLRARTLVSGNVEQAVHVFVKLEAKLKSLRAEFDEAYEERKRENDSIMSEIEELKQTIHDVDFLRLDFKARKKLIAVVNRYLDLRVAARLEEHVSTALTSFEQTVKELRGQLEAVRNSLKNLHRFNKEALDELMQRTAVPGFVQYAMPLESILDWVKGLNISVRRDFTAAQLEPSVLLRNALGVVEEAIQAGLKALNLRNAAQRSTTEGKKLKSCLQSMEESSEPLVKLLESSPGLSDLQPQMFVVGQEAADHAKLFPNPAGGKLSVVDIPNPHFAMCMRTLHEFGMEDWVDYAESLDCYSAKPWYYHALPDSMALPPVEASGGSSR